MKIFTDISHKPDETLFFEKKLHELPFKLSAWAL